MSENGTVGGKNESSVTEPCLSTTYMVSRGNGYTRCKYFCRILYFQFLWSEYMQAE